MSSELMVGGAKKTAGDRVRVPCDWGNEPMLIEGYAITAYDVTCTGTGAPTVTSKNLDYPYQTSAIVYGGSAGTYNLVYSITLNDPDGTVLSRTGTMEIVT